MNNSYTCKKHACTPRSASTISLSSLSQSSNREIAYYTTFIKNPIPFWVTSIHVGTDFVSTITNNTANSKMFHIIRYELFREMISKLPEKREYRQKILANVIEYIYTLPFLRKYIRELYPKKFKSQTLKIGDIANTISDLYNKLYTVDTNPSWIFTIQKLQCYWKKKFRKRVHDDHGPWPDVPSVNDEDPITMETLSECDRGDIWSYSDSKQHVYAFLAKPLKHFIETNGSWNPFTREPFTQADIERLARVVKRLPKENYVVEWKTPRDAFSDVLYSYEKYGFYTLIDWFLDLSPSDVIEIYQHMREDRFVPVHMFTYQFLEDSLVDDPEHGGHMALAKDMKLLIDSNHTMKFYMVCNIFVALAQVCPPLRATLPQWTRMGAIASRNN